MKENKRSAKYEVLKKIKNDLEEKTSVHKFNCNCEECELFDELERVGKNDFLKDLCAEEVLEEKLEEHKFGRVHGTYTKDDEIDEFLDECFDTMAKKGKDYTIGSVDRLANFKNVGEFVDIHMSKVFAVYFYKHIAAIFSYIKNGGQTESEPIEGRIKDCIVYLLLFYKMVKEMQRNVLK